jgi:hypothetical protein
MLHRLEIEYDYDFLLLGISCHEKEYRLCWFLNRALDLQMSLQQPIEMTAKKSTSQHTLYSHQEEQDVRYDLIVNRAEGGYMCPEYKQVDYLLRLNSDMPVDTTELLKTVRKIPIVITAFEIAVENLKSKGNLVLD